MAPAGSLDKNVEDEINRLKVKFETAMDDDLNTSVALSVIFDLVRLANKLFEDKSTTKETYAAVDKLFRLLGGDVLGIVRESYGTTNITVAEHNKLVKIITNLIEERKKARQQKDFAAADRIRDVLVHSDIVVVDEKDGTTRWEEK